MTISEEQRSQIRRLFYADHFAIHTICQSLGLHHETVKRAINHEKFCRKKRNLPSLLDDFTGLIDEKLNLYPRLPSTKLILILRDNGYAGGISLLRGYAKKIKSKVKRAYVRMHSFPGEQGQVDWAHFGDISVGGAKRKLYLFIMVLSNSRALYGRFTFSMKTDCFLRCHEEAFRFFGGCPRVILYDNLKSVVLERLGSTVHFNPQILALSSHYHFEPRPANPYRGNEKGKVERAIRYVRGNFFIDQRPVNIQTLNEDFGRWRDGVANKRAWPDNDNYSITEKWEEEKLQLMVLPEQYLNFREQRLVRSDKMPWIRFDLNRYSIPPHLVGQVLMLYADEATIEIQQDTRIVATHKRSYDKAQWITDEQHKIKRPPGFGSLSFHQNQLITAMPEMAAILESALRRDENMAYYIRHLQKMRTEGGDVLFQQAIGEALSSGQDSLESIRYYLHKSDRLQRRRPVLSLRLPDNPKVKNLEIKSHDLDLYDNL